MLILPVVGGHRVGFMIALARPVSAVQSIRNFYMIRSIYFHGDQI